MHCGKRPLVAQWVKVSLLWLGSQLWCGFNPWPGNFHMLQVWQKKKKKKKKKVLWGLEWDPRAERGC